MSEPLPVGFPVPSPKDTEEIARALEGAAERWREGAFGEALAEVERAASLASTVDENQEPVVPSKRVVALALAVNDLAAYVRKRALGTLKSAEPIAIDLLAVPSSSARSIDVPLDFSSSARSIDLTSSDVESIEASSVPTPRVVTRQVFKAGNTPAPPANPAANLAATLTEGIAPAVAAAAKLAKGSDPPNSFVGVTPKSDFTKTLRSGTEHKDPPRRSFTPARFNAVNVRAAVGDGTPLSVFFDAPTTRRADDLPPSEAVPSAPPTRRADAAYPPKDLVDEARGAGAREGKKDPDGDR